MRTNTWLAFSAVLVAHATVPVSADLLFYSAGPLIYAADLNGAHSELLLESALDCTVRFLAVDPKRDRIYGTEFCTHGAISTVLSVDTDGTNAKSLITEVARFEGIAIDPVADTIYFGRIGFEGSIERADLDGMNLETLASNAGDVSGIALDRQAGLLYWGTFSYGEILRVGVHSGEVTSLVQGLGPVTSVSLDSTSQRLYWVEAPGRVRRKSLIEGSAIEDILTGLPFPMSIALDLVGQKLYWTDMSEQQIHRANLDGTDREDVLSQQSVQAVELLVRTVAVTSNPWGRVKDLYR